MYASVRGSEAALVSRRAPLRLVLLGVITLSAMRDAGAPRTDWIDPDTGHRVIRLSIEPGSQTLYFHDNAYSPEGDKFVFTSPNGIMLVNLSRLGGDPPSPELIVPNGGGA